MTNRNQVRKEAVDLTVDTNLKRQPKQQKLRNAEYYDMQDVMDATEADTIAKYLDILKLDDKALKKVNSLRLSAGNLEIVANAN